MGFLKRQLESLGSLGQWAHVNVHCMEDHITQASTLNFTHLPLDVFPATQRERERERERVCYLSVSMNGASATDSSTQSAPETNENNLQVRFLSLQSHYFPYLTK